MTAVVTDFTVGDGAGHPISRSVIQGNLYFLRAVYGPLAADEHGWTCSFRASPNSSEADWTGSFFQFGGYREQFNSEAARLLDNNYFCTAVLRRDAQGKAHRNKASFSRLAVLLADDVALQDLRGSVSYIIQTSSGKHQAGCIINSDDSDAQNPRLVDALLQEMVRQQFVKADKSGNNAVRYGRQAYGTNTKTGEVTQLTHWDPENTFTLADAAAIFGIDLDVLRQPAATTTPIARISPEPGGDSSDWGGLLEGFTRPNLDQRTYHDSLLRFTAKLVASGTAAGATVNLTRALMDANRPPTGAELARWEKRRDEVPRMAQEAARKFAPLSQPVGINLSPAATGSAGSRSFRLLTADDIRQLPPIRWLVREVLPVTGVAAVYGQSGSGKSFLVLDLAAAIAGGREWFGRKVRQTNVVYVCLEGEGGLRQRQEAWEQRNETSMPVGFRAVLQPFSLTESEDVESLAAAVREEVGDGAVVVIDTLNRAAGGKDENSSKDMSELIKSASRLGSLTGGLVLLVHHSGKDESRGLRGHSSLGGALDTSVEVKRSGPRREWSVHKQKDGRDGFGEAFQLETVQLPADSDGEQVSSCVVAPLQASIDLAALGLPRGVHQTTALEVLGEVVGEDGSMSLAAAVEVVAASLKVKKNKKDRAKDALTGLAKWGAITLDGDTVRLPVSRNFPDSRNRELREVRG